MKITVTFEASDFEGSGQWLVRSNSTKIKDDSYLATILFKVGWFSRNGGVALISMTDGMIQSFSDTNDLVKWLNSNTEKGYRMATMQEVVRAVKSQVNRTA